VNPETKWTALDETISCQFGRYDDEDAARLEAQRRASVTRHVHTVLSVEVRKDERRLTKASCEICREAVPTLDDIVLRLDDILTCANKDCRRAATAKVRAGHVAVSATGGR
jgi:hypothetical protein